MKASVEKICGSGVNRRKRIGAGNWGTVVVGVMTIGIWGEEKYLRIFKSLGSDVQKFYCNHSISRSV